MTPEERILWGALRYKRRLCGFHFRRQQVISGYIVDFHCPSARLAVEVDGDVHLATRAYDAKRERALRKLGISTMRVSNQAVAENLTNVLRKIGDETQLLFARHQSDHTPSPSP